MAPISCSEFRNRLESWFEGKSGADRPADYRAHARDCRACGVLLEDFSALESAARELGSVEPEPPEHIWLSLSEQLEREGLIRTDQAIGAEAPRRGWFGGIASWLRGSAWGVPRPVFAAGYLAAIIVIGFSLSGPIHHQVVDYEWREGTQTSDINAHLTLAAERTIALPAANPVVTASLHDNLAIVDNYIALCEKSVRKDPQNEIARDYLYDAYQQKAYLLAQMNERGD